MADLSKYSTQALVSELSRRAEQVDKVMNALASLDRPQVAVPRFSPAKKKRVKKKGRRVLDQTGMLATMKTVGKPLTSAQLHKRMRKGTLSGTLSMLNRLRAAGKVKSSGSRPNLLWAPV